MQKKKIKTIVLLLTVIIIISSQSRFYHNLKQAGSVLTRIAKIYNIFGQVVTDTQHTQINSGSEAREDFKCYRVWMNVNDFFYLHLQELGNRILLK